MPAILAELGFITNPVELALAKSDRYREDCSRALTVSILKYFSDIQGVNIEIDPNSLYSWPYEDELVQPVMQQEAQQTIIETVEHQSEFPLPEEPLILPEN
jgi:hypothetical protein